MRCFKYSFCNSLYLWRFKSFSGFANILLYIPVKMGNKVKKVLSPLCSVYMIFLWSSKYYFVFTLWFTFLFFFFIWSYSQRCFNVAQRSENRHWKWQRCFERRFNFVQGCKLQHWRLPRWFDVVRRHDVTPT